MINRRHVLFSLGSLLGTDAARPAQDDDALVLRARDLQADTDVLAAAYRSLHPGLYRYSTPAEVELRLAALRASFDQDCSLASPYLAYSRFAATVRCGHTYANFYNQPRAVRQRLFADLPCVPFEFRWLDGRMIVTRNLSTRPELVPGTDVLAIDGLSSREILRRLMTVARADGANDAKRRAWMQVQGTEQLEAFDVFLPLVHPRVGKTQTLTIAPPLQAGLPIDVEVQAATAEARLAARTPAPPAGTALWSLDRSDPRIAVLRMPSWVLYDGQWDWQAYLRQTFETLVTARVPALVIDLRANEGGSDVGPVIAAHLIDRDLLLPQDLRLVRYRKVPDELVPFLDTWDPSFRDWGDAAVRFDARYYRLTRVDQGERRDGMLIRPERPRYRGRVFVLVGATNSSATFEFAQMVKQARLATLVGQTTGGNLRGINGGAFFFLRLPHSGIELDLPLIGQFPTSPQPDAGLDPDVPVRLTRAGIAAGRDAEMDEVRRLLGLAPS